MAATHIFRSLRQEGGGAAGFKTHSGLRLAANGRIRSSHWRGGCQSQLVLLQGPCACGVFGCSWGERPGCGGKRWPRVRPVVRGNQSRERGRWPRAQPAGSLPPRRGDSSPVVSPWCAGHIITHREEGWKAMVRPAPDLVQEGRFNPEAKKAKPPSPLCFTTSPAVQ